MKKKRTRECMSVKRIDWLINRGMALTDDLDRVQKSKQSYVLNCDSYIEYFEKLGWPKDADK